MDVWLTKGFNIVIGNPPWVSLSGKHGIEENKKNTKKLIALFSGNTSMPNLYEYFILKSMSLLNNGGMLSFIIPDRLGSNNSMSYLRRKIIYYNDCQRSHLQMEI
jgi:methylase of polypeptide subunit release factors